MDYSDRFRLSGPDKDQLAAQLAKRLDLDYDELVASRILHLMTPREISEMAAKGVEFQLHTHRHRLPVERHLFEREILENRQIIQTITGRIASHFCYPSGVVNRTFFPWLRQLEVASGTTCEPGIASVDLDPLALPRFQDTSKVSDLQFEGWTSGFIPWALDSTTGRWKRVPWQ